MNSRSKIRLFFALEVIVWLLVIVLVVGGMKLHFSKKQNEYRTYRIFMQDVDGLIEGSSVRMMGVPIGYVKSINIVQDEVYIKFVVTNKSIQLPQGAIATVEFNGMAGSKSLEIYPPDSVSKASGKLISIKRTSRLGAALGLFVDMFNKIDSIIVRCVHFSEGLEQVRSKATKVKSDTELAPGADESIELLNNYVEKYDMERRNFIETITPKHKNIFEGLFTPKKEVIEDEFE